MPAIGVMISWLMGAVGLSLGSWVGRVLIALGISYVTYSGFDVLFGSVKTEIFGLLGTASGSMAGVIGLSRIGEVINITFSALAARMALGGLTGGSFTKQVFK